MPRPVERSRIAERLPSEITFLTAVSHVTPDRIPKIVHIYRRRKVDFDGSEEQLRDFQVRFALETGSGSQTRDNSVRIKPRRCGRSRVIRICSAC